MPYASNDRIGHDPFPDSIEITQEQYDEALMGMMEGKIVSVNDGFSVAFPSEPEPEPVPEPTIDEIWDALRAQRDSRINATDWLILRHAEEITPTLTQQQYDDLLTYRQALRDLPENTEDPANPEWPNEPDI